MVVITQRKCLNRYSFDRYKKRKKQKVRTHTILRVTSPIVYEECNSSVVIITKKINAFRLENLLTQMTLTIVYSTMHSNKIKKQFVDSACDNAQ